VPQKTLERHPESNAMGALICSPNNRHHLEQASGEALVTAKSGPFYGLLSSARRSQRDCGGRTPRREPLA
jgi:hypothetical protein